MNNEQIKLTLFLHVFLIAYSLVPIRRLGSINWHTSFIWPCTFPKIWGVTINWINTQFWSTSRGSFDKNNSAPIAYTFEGVSFNWIMTFPMSWGVTINWNMYFNWNGRVLYYKLLHWSKIIYQNPKSRGCTYTRHQTSSLNSLQLSICLKQTRHHFSDKTQH